MNFIIETLGTDVRLAKDCCPIEQRLPFSEGQTLLSKHNCLPYCLMLTDPISFSEPSR